MKLDHAAIGNGRVLALVAPDSSIDWLCLPRFDSPSVFARLLDIERGGNWAILPAEGEVRGNLRYIPNTNVVSTHFEAAGAAWEVVDFAPRIPDGLTMRCPVAIVRLVRPLAGRPMLRVVFDPRPDYARRAPELRENSRGVEVGGFPGLELVTNIPAPHILSGRAFVLDQPLFMMLRLGTRDEPPSMARVQHDLELTVAAWRAWVKNCALPPFASEQVIRSALCLKLHASEDSGAIIAAATTSVPEAIGTPRTWDYRYCWLRDAAFVVESLRYLGHLHEGERFLRFLRDVALAGPLQPVYGIDGERELPEIALDHLAGFRGNGYVRIGNAAYMQQQNDVMGEMILCLDALLNDPRLAHEDSTGYFPLIRRLVEKAIARAPEPDMGIWEFRSMLRPYTFSRAMCWVAMSRGARIARKAGHADLGTMWEAQAAAEQEEILRRGYSTEHRCFTQALDGKFPDASNLLLPTLGLLDAKDPRFLATLDTYAERLVLDGLMLRYRNDDDFGTPTSAFSICTFWWATALAQAGRLKEAITVFERIAGFANPVGLFSEDIDPSTGDLLGNFPQAYTHVGLIQAATTIGSLLEAERGHLLAWS